MRSFLEFLNNVDKINKIVESEEELLQTSYINANKLALYLDVSSKFLSPEAKSAIQYLIDNNSTYMRDFESLNMPLREYIETSQLPSDNQLKQFIKNCRKINKVGRLLEIPIFQAPEQFEGILSKKYSPDEIILDLTTSAGRDAIAKQYTPLVYKIARSYIGKSNFDMDELLGFGFEGLTIAMNKYGKTTKFSDNEDAIKNYSFGSYAAYIIQFTILDAIKKESNLVSIPTNVQKAERKEKGANTRQNNIAGDATIGDDDNSKSVFDLMQDKFDSSLTSAEQNELNELWQELYNILEERYSTRDADILFAFYGLQNRKQLSGKEIATKYSVAPSNVTRILKTLKEYIMNDNEAKEIITDIYELMGN